MKTNTLRNLMFFGVAALPMTAMAATPDSALGFGASYYYETTGGKQNVVYDTTYVEGKGYTVGANPIIDDGFAQYTLTDTATGVTYFQTIIGGGASQANDCRNVCTNATGLGFVAQKEFFDTESFVRIGATGGTGIAVNQVVDDLRGGNFGTLQSDSIIYTGADFLDPATQASVQLSQTVTDSANGAIDPITGVITAAPFSADFAFNAYLHDLDGIGGRDDIVGVLELNQTINPGDASFDDSFKFNSTSFQNNGDAVATVQAASVDIQTLVNLGAGSVSDQDFQYDKRSGQVAAVGSLTAGEISTLSALADNPLYAGVTTTGSGSFVYSGADLNLPLSATVDAQAIDWVVGDTIDRVLISQQVPNAGDFGFGSIADRVDTGVAGDDGVPTSANEYQSDFDLASSNASNINYGVSGDPFL